MVLLGRRMRCGNAYVLLSKPAWILRVSFIVTVALEEKPTQHARAETALRGWTSLCSAHSMQPLDSSGHLSFVELELRCWIPQLCSNQIHGHVIHVISWDYRQDEWAVQMPPAHTLQAWCMCLGNGRPQRRHENGLRAIMTWKAPRS